MKFTKIKLRIVFLILLYKYKGKLSSYEKEQKSKEKQVYIMSKIQQLSSLKSKTSGSMITDLPNWNDHPEMTRLGTI